MLEPADDRADALTIREPGGHGAAMLAIPEPGRSARDESDERRTIH